MAALGSVAGMLSRGKAIAAAALVACALAAVPADAATAPPTRYSLAGGCWSLAPASGGGAIGAASQLRLQATDLGSYMLYGTAGDFVAADGDTVEWAAEPGPAADWMVEGATGSFTLSPHSDPARVLA